MADIEFRLELPATPLQGELEMERPMRNMLGPEFVAGVHSALTFSPDQVLPVYNAAGRNYYLPLPRPAGPYDALQVAGGGNFDLGITSTGDVLDSIVDPEATTIHRVVVPPAERLELFTGHTGFYENGVCVERANQNPIGSYTARSANQKIKNTQTAFGLLAARSAGVITPKYVGKFTYELADQHGDPQTAILLLVPSLGHRFDSTLLLPLNVMRAGMAPSAGEQFAEHLVPYYQKILGPRFRTIGAGIQAVHAAGVTHHQLTPGNTDVLVGPQKVLIPYITDWDTMRHPEEADKRRAQALDMTIAFQSASTVLKRLARLEMIDQETRAELTAGTVLAMLAGYQEGKGTLAGKSVSPADAANVAASHYELDKMLDLVEEWLA